jgi:hypothetical protein
LTLGQVQRCVEAIGGTTNIVGLGYIVVKMGATERILPHAITERFLTGGSIIEQIRHHAGIVTVERYEVIGGR